MRATVLPLEGKHYGTQVVIEADEATTTIDVWVPVGRPSAEWIAEYGYTVEQYENDEVVIDTDYLWGDDTVLTVQQIVGPFDSHYQSQVEYDIAHGIAEAINRGITEAEWEMVQRVRSYRAGTHGQTFHDGDQVVDWLLEGQEP